MFCGHHNSRNISAEQSVFGWIQASAIHDITRNRELQVYNEVRLDSNSIFIVTSKHYKVWKPNISTISKMVFVQSCCRYLNVRNRRISNGPWLYFWKLFEYSKLFGATRRNVNIWQSFESPFWENTLCATGKVHSNWCVCYGQFDSHSLSTRYLSISAVKS